MLNRISLSTGLQPLISNSTLILDLLPSNSSRPTCFLMIVPFLSLLFIRRQPRTIIRRIVFIYPLISIQMRMTSFHSRMNIQPVHGMMTASFHLMSLSSMSIIVWRLVCLFIEWQVALTFNMFCIQSTIFREGYSLYLPLDISYYDLILLSLLSQRINLYLQLFEQVNSIHIVIFLQYPILLFYPFENTIVFLHLWCKLFIHPHHYFVFLG